MHYSPSWRPCLVPSRVLGTPLRRSAGGTGAENEKGAVKRVGGLQFMVGGIAVYRRIAFGYRKIKATVSPQLTSLSSIEPVIKV